MRTLHALIVGIDDYADDKILNLEAAVHDSERVAKYFQDNQTENYVANIKTLQDKNATRQNIIDTFQTHLIDSNASEDDVLLFYYSGHGGQELAGDAFQRFSPSGKLENLACHDASLKSGKGFLADKELRWLIYQAARSGAHFLSISDSCHSGGNTRGVGVHKLPKGQARLSGLAERPRNNNEFLFADKIDFKKLATNSLDDVIPQGNHISIAACQSHESAFEVSAGGIFTTGFLNFLNNSKGDISYFDLKSRIKSFVGGQFDQVPQVYCSHEDPKFLFQTFLGGVLKDKPVYANVSYNHVNRKWEIDKGAIYGITKNWNGVQQQLVIQNPHGEAQTAFVTKVFPAKAEIAFAPYSDVLRSEQYQAYIPSMMSRQMIIHLTGDEAGIKFLEENISKEKRAAAGIKFSHEAENADYALRADSGEYSITLPGNERPLTSQEKGYAAPSHEKILEKLTKIGKWHFAKNLQNAETKLSANAIKIEVFEGQQLINVSDNIFKIGVHPETLKTPIKIKLTNQSGQSLHCGMIYLSSLFGMSPKLIQGQVERVENGRELWARGGNFINLKLEDYITDLNWEEEVFYVQIVVSNQDFGLELFLQDELDAPRGATKGVRRGMDEDDWLDDDEPDWRTYLLEFRLKNPKV